ncbi:MAG: signal peptidase II [Bacteroidetes bacterium]|nr:signal peptidase II [Bacteroidota bacterium]
MKFDKTKLLVFALLVFGSVGCDRVTKDLAKTHLDGLGEFSYLNDTFRLIYVENPGAAMSFGADWNPDLKFWILSLLPVTVLGLVLGFVLKNINRLSLMHLTGLGLIIAGGVGNLLDRFFNNHLVPDFMNLGINTVRTGIFNVADVCITAGIIIILFTYKSMERATSELQAS